MFWRPSTSRDFCLQRLLPKSLVVDASRDFVILVYAIPGVDIASLIGPDSDPCEFWPQGRQAFAAMEGLPLSDWNKLIDDERIHWLRELTG